MAKFQNVIFDFDSTLTSLEGLDAIAKKRGLEKKITKITSLGMDGQITFDQSLAMRLAILKPKVDDFTWLSKEYRKNILHGVRELINQLQNNDVNVFIVTGGPRPAIENIVIELGIPKNNIWATCFMFDNLGNSRLDTNCVMGTSEGKSRVVQLIAKIGKTAVVGDGMTDYQAGKHADLFIGFGGVVKRQSVKSKAKIYVEESNLKFLAKYLIPDTI